MIHTSSGRQRLGSLIMPTLGGFDGDGAAFCALRQEGRRFVRRGFVTDLLDPPRRAPLPAQRGSPRPDGRHWVAGPRACAGDRGAGRRGRAQPASFFVRAWSRPVWEDDDAPAGHAHPRSAPGRRTPRPRGHAEPRRRLVAVRRRRLRPRRGHLDQRAARRGRRGRSLAPDGAPRGAAVDVDVDRVDGVEVVDPVAAAGGADELVLAGSASARSAGCRARSTC